MKKTADTIPKFKNEDEERKFWATHSPLDYFDAGGARRATFPNLKPSLKSISIRLPADMLAELKSLANKFDVPYQSLAKVYLARQIALERGTLSRSPGKKSARGARGEDPGSEDYESLTATAYLLRNPRNARRLLESIKELEEGRG
jgi:predicted DNA binding CopG/RHH family protein